MINEKFGRLKVILKSSTKKHNRTSYECLCDCGNMIIVTSNALKSGNTTSCGCLRKDFNNRETHGLRDHKLYNVYNNMIARCYNEKFKYYYRYGGRGISICKEWLYEFICFYNWAISSGWEDGLEIERVNNDGNYEPSNCKWVTRKQNVRNRNNTSMIEISGNKVPLAEVAEKLGLKYSTLWQRIYKLKWPIERAINTVY